jgi:DNA polymerase-3 subunit gamma/tau
MSYVSLYRRFRPNTFDGVVGQDHIIKTITNQIKLDRIGHAYLFTGTRGTGKTSCAKIFAKAVNCLNPVNGSPCGKCEVCKALQESENMDIIEMDAASNNGVDEIRELRENVQYRPTYGRFKVYIIDEVHMLSSSAFNALLKTLEEPPEHIIFVLATTEVQKLPQTILSRCMRFDFRLVEVDVIVGLLKKIFDELKVTYEDDALKQIAIQGEGSVRDALSLADMCLSYCGSHIGYKDTLDILCASNFDTLDVLGRAIISGNVGIAIDTAEQLLKEGRNTVAKDLANYFMDVLEIKNSTRTKIDSISPNQIKKLTEAGQDASNYRLARIMDIMAGMESTLRYSTQPRIILEANIVRACELVTELNLDGLTNRVKDLEKKINDISEKGITVSVQPKEIDNTIPRETKLVKNVKEVKNEKIEPLEEKKTDIELLLEEMSIKAEEKAVFEETPIQSEENNFQAMEKWNKILVRLTEMNEDTLYNAVSNINKDIIINEDLIIAYTTDKVTLELLKKQKYLKVIQQVVKEELGDNFVFKCEAPKTDKKGLKPEVKIQLTDLFGKQANFKE